MKPRRIEVQDLVFHYGFFQDHKTLDGVSFSIEAGSFTGLLGRNGSGKSTVSMLLAGLMRPWSGSIKIDGVEVFENAEAMANVCYTSDSTTVYRDNRITRTLRLWELTRPNWDAELAGWLLETFKIDVKKRPSSLSRGQQSAFYATLGLASRCPVTIFDEVHLGMDAVVREIFYRTLLSDYAENPRTIIISSHLIEEIENLLDHVVFIDGGHIIESGDVDEVRERHSTPGHVASFTEILTNLTITPAQQALFAPNGERHDD
ncbi:MAG: ABC transporter ATP-binding protein [Actinomycetaceae bacterium]|nr:ABC transporter ATP-binding protein [Actinomycetaceae bacterium]